MSRRLPAPLPHDAALIVIDIQRAIDHPRWGQRNNLGAEKNVAALLQAWRSSRRPIYHIRHDSTEPESHYRPGQPGNEFKPEVQPLPGVIEADYGDWTGGNIADLVKTDEWRVVQAAPSRAQFPGGETLRAMQSRMVDALDAVVAAHPHETVVVVSHADPIKSAIAHYTGMHLDLFQRLHVSPASVTVLDFHPYGALLVKCNDTGGLVDLLPEPENQESKEVS